MRPGFGVGDRAGFDFRATIPSIMCVGKHVQRLKGSEVSKGAVSWKRRWNAGFGSCTAERWLLPQPTKLPAVTDASASRPCGRRFRDRS